MITKSLPSLFTIANLFLGIISIIFVFNERPDLAVVMVVIAMLTDGLDGRVARALNVQSDFGKELDSLSDIISFGVAPAFIMYVVAFQDLNAAAGWIVTAIFPICGALRLARFNVMTSTTPGYFIGLPIPAAGGILCMLALFAEQLPIIVLLISTLLLSFLMISNIKYPNFKKVGFSKRVIWVTPLIILGAIPLAVQFPGYWSKLLLIPLLVYALYGLKKNVSVLVLKLLRRKKREQNLELDESQNFKYKV